MQADDCASARINFTTPVPFSRCAQHDPDTHNTPDNRTGFACGSSCTPPSEKVFMRIIFKFTYYVNRYYVLRLFSLSENNPFEEKENQ